MNYSNEIKREIILDHSQNPRNERIDEKYCQKQLKNPACGDIITLYVDFEEKQIKDICYQVSGCSLCVSSTSIMSQLVNKKSIAEVEKIINEMTKMLTNEKYDQAVLGDANCFEGIKDVAPRIKCVTLPYKALKELIGDNNEQL